MNERGFLDGIAYRFWPPRAASGPAPAVVVLHGAGSSKESHADFARVAAANGFAALTFDNRGHGESQGHLGAGALEDIATLLSWLGQREEVDQGRIVVRGSSMGGLLAIHAAAEIDSIAGAIAICPAPESHLLVDLRRVAAGQPPSAGSALKRIRADVPALIAWLSQRDMRSAVGRIAPRPLFLVHARGDASIPCTYSEELYRRAGDPKRLLLLEGGDHRSAQHDPEVQAETLRWVERNLNA